MNIDGVGRWSVTQFNSRIYFMYRDNFIGSFDGDMTAVEYMVTCINAGLAAFAPIYEAVKAEESRTDA